MKSMIVKSDKEEIIMKPTFEQFKEYLEIQNSGVTNMFDIRTIMEISYTGLTKEICHYIMQNYCDLETEFGITIDDV